MKTYDFIVEEDYQGERVDRYLSEVLADFSRSYIQKLISDDNVTINDKKCKSSSRLNLNDKVIVNCPDSVVPDIVAENIPLDIIYEDADVLVVNKTKNMVVHPAAGHYEHTLVNAIMYHCADNLSGINGVMRPGIVHRIDKDTTGSIIVCKNDKAHESIASQLKVHSIKREYIAICEGNIEENEGVINKSIGRSPSDRKKMAVNVANGKDAITHYEVIERFKGYTYIKCILETGRTHQIRVHMASIGHPIVGDMVYGCNKPPVKTDGQALHAYILGFVHPRTEEYIETVATIPEYFNKLLLYLRNNKVL